MTQYFLNGRETTCERLLELAESNSVTRKFAGGEAVKTTWRERLSDLLHFRWPQRTKFVPDEPTMPTPKGGKVIRWRRYDDLEDWHKTVDVTGAILNDANPIPTPRTHCPECGRKL